MARREFSDKVKRQARDRSGYVCEAIRALGTACLTPVADGNPVEYDHVIPDWMGGEPTLENCAALCKRCHKLKTALDAADRAQAKRRRDRHDGIDSRSRRWVRRGLPTRPDDKPSPCRVPEKLAGLPRNTFVDRPG